MEGDWHDIPSIRGILKHDIKLAKILRERLQAVKGCLFCKECFKKVLPQEYETIRELKGHHCRQKRYLKYINQNPSPGFRIFNQRTVVCMKE